MELNAKWTGSKPDAEGVIGADRETFWSSAGGLEKDGRMNLMEVVTRNNLQHRLAVLVRTISGGYLYISG